MMRLFAACFAGFAVAVAVDGVIEGIAAQHAKIAVAAGVAWASTLIAMKPRKVRTTATVKNHYHRARVPDEDDE